MDERLAQAGVQQKKKNKFKAPRYTFGDLDPEDVVADKNLDEADKLSVLKANLVAQNSEKGKGKGKEKAAGGKGGKAAGKGGKDGKHGEKGRSGGKGSKGDGWSPKNYSPPPWGGGHTSEHKGKSKSKGKGKKDSAKGSTGKGKGKGNGSKGKKKGGEW